MGINAPLNFDQPINARQPVGSPCIIWRKRPDALQKCMRRWPILVFKLGLQFGAQPSQLCLRPLAAQILQGILGGSRCRVGPQSSRKGGFGLSPFVKVEVPVARRHATAEAILPFGSLNSGTGFANALAKLSGRNSVEPLLRGCEFTTIDQLLCLIQQDVRFTPLLSGSESLRRFGRARHPVQNGFEFFCGLLMLVGSKQRLAFSQLALDKLLKTFINLFQASQRGLELGGGVAKILVPVQSHAFGVQRLGGAEVNSRPRRVTHAG
ncbi:MAG: hypothetical protein F4220_04265 [Gammaproteobacteria bacterium]|nr:hypothetical protein [Gammaproteobacteria bacterium]